MSKHIKLITDSSITITRAADVLKQQGIACIIKNHVESGRLAGFGTSHNDVDLWIEENDLEKAQSILKEFHNS
ncbi:putative signal transducing protein [Nonlabens sp.]|uniref:putative signal transducing protein n=1 Tax=Nonlabens sp. TaxID=1888209 RepID=UPI003F69F76A